MRYKTYNLTLCKKQLGKQENSFLHESNKMTFEDDINTIKTILRDVISI